MITALDAGLSHEEFWDLTMHEVLLSVKAHKRKVDRDHHTLAWLIRWVLSGWVKKPPSINRILGRPSLMGMSREQIADHFRRKAGK